VTIDLTLKEEYIRSVSFEAYGSKSKSYVTNGDDDLITLKFKYFRERDVFEMEVEYRQFSI